MTDLVPLSLFIVTCTISTNYKTVTTKALKSQEGLTLFTTSFSSTSFLLPLLLLDYLCTIPLSYLSLVFFLELHKYRITVS